MLKLQHKKLIQTMLLALLGLGYFSTFSTFEISFVLKSFVALLPLQIGALVYLGYLRSLAHKSQLKH